MDRPARRAAAVKSVATGRRRAIQDQRTKCGASYRIGKIASEREPLSGASCAADPPRRRAATLRELTPAGTRKPGIGSGSVNDKTLVVVSLPPVCQQCVGVGRAYRRKREPLSEGVVRVRRERTARLLRPWHDNR